MKRIVCIVEGHGEVLAVPVLCRRVLGWLEIDGWFVDRAAIRIPRSRLVDEKLTPPGVGSHLERAVELAYRNSAAAALVVCDSDGDCPVKWSQEAREAIRSRLPGDAVMVVKEFEAWFLWSMSDARRRERRIGDPDRIRGAKNAFSKVRPDYKPSVHQVEEVKRLSLDRVYRSSRSFRKLVTSIAAIVGAKPPELPSGQKRRPRRRP